MGNSNIAEAEGAVEVYRHSCFYGRHELRDEQVVKKYEVPPHERDAFLGLVDSYRKAHNLGLIAIQHLADCGTHFELTFPHYPLTLAAEMAGRSAPYSQAEVTRLLLHLTQALAICAAKQFPYSEFVPERIAVKEDGQGYYIGIDVLMNPNDPLINAQFLSPEASRPSQSSPYDRSRSALYSLGLIALKCLRAQPSGSAEESAFELRKSCSFEFCTLLEGILRPQNHHRLTVEECMELSREIGEESEQQMRQREFIRGYNCVESQWLLTSPAPRQRPKPRHSAA